VKLGLVAAAFALSATACATRAPERAHYAPVEIAFERGVQGHIVIPVSIEGVEGFAVLDNGASTSVINRELAEEKKLEHGFITRTVIKIMTSGFELGQPADIEVGGIQEKVTPLLLDIQLLSNVAGKDLLGIVGEEFFERHVVEVDFIRNVLRLHDPRTFVAPADLPALELKSSKTAKTRIPAIVEGESGHEITFDLGASGYAAIDEGDLADRMLADGRPWMPRISGIVVKGEFARSEGRTMTAKEINFGGFSLLDIPTDVAPRGFVAPSDISLGVNALSRFDLIFDVGGKRMWMRPNANFLTPFPHPVIGLNFALSSQPGALEILSVSASSPAEKAGLRRGDVVAKLNGEEASIAAFGKIVAGDAVELELKTGAKRTLTAARFF
jgi:PDZ domain